MSLEKLPKLAKEDYGDFIDKSDRISRLTEPIIQHILSYLSSKESTCTSLLSKSLLQAWSTRPVLDFNANLNLDFMQHVVKTLQNYCEKRMPIHTFKLHIKKVDNNVDRVRAQKWLFDVVKIALQRGIVELDLSTTSFSLPFQDKSLNWCNIKKLKLESLPIDQHTFFDLISSCPLLTNLHLEGCIRVKRIFGLKFPNLIVFYLGCKYNWVGKVDFSAPKLESFTCSNVGLVNIDEAESLKSLSLSFSNMGEMHLQCLLSKCPLLEVLKLEWCRDLKSLKFSSHSIKILSFHECHDLVKVDIDAPNLTMLEYVSNYKEIALPSFITTRDTRKSKCSISLWCESSIDLYWFHKVNEFLANFRSSSLNLITKSPKNIWYYDLDMSWRNKYYFEVLEETFTVMRPIPSDNYEHVMESLMLKYEEKIHEDEVERYLQMCRPKYVVCDYLDEFHNHKIMKKLCNNIWQRNVGRNCCDRGGTGGSRKGFKCRCWRHYIKEANIFGKENRPLFEYDLKWLSSATKGRVQIAFALDWKQTDMI